MSRPDATVIRVKSGETILGHLSAEQFREHMNAKSSIRFLGDLIKAFNEEKARIGAPERAEQIINPKLVK